MVYNSVEMADCIMSKLVEIRVKESLIVARDRNLFWVQNLFD